jgi:hypothetical protein
MNQKEFYQLVEYVDNVDILKRLKEWETFYTLYQPNAALRGKTPYELLREKLIPTEFFPDPSSPKKGRIRKKITFALLPTVAWILTAHSQT